MAAGGGGLSLKTPVEHQQTDGVAGEGALPFRQTHDG